MNGLLKLKYKEIQSEVDSLKITEGLYKTERDLEEHHLDKIEKGAEVKLKKLEEDRIKYSDDLNQRQMKNIELSKEIQELTSATKDHSKLNTLKTQIGTKKAEVDKQRDFFTKNDDCPVCEQPIKKSFKKLRNSELLDQSKKYEDAMVEMDREIVRLNDILKDMQKKSSIMQHNIAEVNALSKLIQKCIDEMEELEEAKEEQDSMKKRIEEMNTNLQEVDFRLKELKEENFYLDICKNLLHDTGIKSKIIKQYLPVMNQTIQKYLTVLDFYVNFHLNDQFEETIKSRYRDDFSYSSFSEGEKMRIDLALMFTWREVARLKNSTNTNLLIMDEVFDSSLDAAGTDDFLKILNELESQNIFVISHKGDVLFDKFYSMMKFEKQNNFSKIVES